MNAFINADGVLTSWGYAESNNDDTLVVVSDDFNYQPGTVRYDGTNWIPYTAPADPLVQRTQRDFLLRTIYDPGINMALRALRVATTTEETTYAQGKVAELDAYAIALQGVPEQPGFPDTITWPTPPTA